MNSNNSINKVNNVLSKKRLVLTFFFTIINEKMSNKTFSHVYFVREKNVR